MTLAHPLSLGLGALHVSHHRSIIGTSKWSISKQVLALLPRPAFLMTESGLPLAIGQAPIVVS